MAVIKSGATTDQWTVDPTSKAGRVTLYDVSGNVISSLTKSDTQATGSLGALNAAVTVAMNGQLGAGFQLVVGTLVGTLIAQISYDNGVTWNQTQFYDTTRDAYNQSIIFTAANGAAASSIDGASGVTHVRVIVSAYTSGTANATLTATASARGHVVTTAVDGGKSTYRYSKTAFAPIAGVNLVITGSSTKTLRVTKIILSGTAGTAVFEDVVVQRYSAISGGTSAPIVAGKNDVNDPSATAVVSTYSVVPTTATANGGPLAAEKLLLLATATLTTLPHRIIFEFGEKPGARECVLRGISDFVGLTFSALPATGAVDLYLELTEE